MKNIFLFIVIMCTFNLMGQDLKKNIHPIDVNYKKCLDIPVNQDTKGMISCAAEAKKAWENEMNKYYKLLQNKLTEVQKKKLIASQEAWKKFKEQEFSFSSDLYFDIGGTMWHFVSADNETEFIKQRANRLKSYYDTLTEENF